MLYYYAMILLQQSVEVKRNTFFVCSSIKYSEDVDGTHTVTVTFRELECHRLSAMHPRWSTYGLL